MEIILYFAEHEEASLEKLVFNFLFLSQRAGQEGTDLSKAWRSRFQLRKVILNLSILAKPDGSPRPPAPPAPRTCRAPGPPLYLFTNYPHFLLGSAATVYPPP